MRFPGTKRTALFLGFMAACAMVVGWVAARYAQEELEARSHQNLNLMCAKHSEQLNALLGRIEQSVSALSFYAVEQLESAQRMRRDLAYLEAYTMSLLPVALNTAVGTEGAMSIYVRYNPDFTPPTSGFFWTREERDGSFQQREVTDLSRPSADALEYVGLYHIPVEEGGPVWLAPFYKSNVNKLIVSYAAPLYKDGVAVGIIGMDIDCAILESMVEEIAVYRTGHALLLDADNGIHYHPSREAGGWSTDVSPEMLSAVKSAGPDGNALTTYEWDGQATCMVFQKLKNGLHLVVCVPEKEIADAQNDLGRRITILTLLILGAAVTGAVLTHQSSKRAIELYIERETNLDELSGVYSRKYFFEKAREKIDQSDEGSYIVRLNVCNFKNINDLYGTENGDRLLREIGDGLLKESDGIGFIAARFTADHFYLCVQQSGLEKFPFVRRVNIPWLNLDVYLNYGVYPVEDQRDMSVSNMCARADTALSSRNNSSTDFIHYYNDLLRQQKMREQEMEREMENAIVTKQFSIYIQPKYDAETQRIVGGEALVRWVHPEKGFISPGEFIPLFERNGFIRTLDYYVWEACCAFIREARNKGLCVPSISINVSRSHFYGTELQSNLTELLEKYQLEPADLELEITETIYGESPEIIIDQCAKLRAAGFQIAMDDFGSGYSSLNMLKELPLDVIKMDLRFLTGDAAQREKGQNILRSLICMAHELNLQVVVEGVETKEQYDFIQNLGGCLIQGYYFARPMTTQEFIILLNTQESHG